MTSCLATEYQLYILLCSLCVVKPVFIFILSRTYQIISITSDIKLQFRDVTMLSVKSVNGSEYDGTRRC